MVLKKKKKEFDLLAPLEKDDRGQLSGEGARVDVILLGHFWVATHIDLSCKRRKNVYPDSFYAEFGRKKKISHDNKTYHTASSRCVPFTILMLCSSHIKKRVCATDVAVTT